MKKQEIYVNLQGKTKEELKDLWEFLKENNEPTYRDTKKSFLKYANDISCNLYHDDEEWISCSDLFYVKGKTEVTIDQLKQIIKPMGTFTPIAMKCNKEQFDAVNEKINGKEKFSKNYDYAFFNTYYNRLDQCKKGYAKENNLEIHEEWNEEIFLKACGIEVETLQEKALRLENELSEVKNLIDEENKPKVGLFYNLIKKDALIGVLDNKAYLDGKTIYFMVGLPCIYSNFDPLTKQQLIEWYDSRSTKN